MLLQCFTILKPVQGALHACHVDCPGECLLAHQGTEMSTPHRPSRIRKHRVAQKYSIAYSARILVPHFFMRPCYGKSEDQASFPLTFPFVVHTTLSVIIVILIITTRYSRQKGRVRPAEKLQAKAAKFLPLIGLA